MYESPVKIIAQNVQMKLEDNVVSAIQKLGIDINKEELIKALDYDRQQYIKGYADGKHDAQFQWIPCSERLPNREEYMKNNGLFNVSDGNRSYSEWFDIRDKQRFGEPTMSGFRVDYAVIAWMPLPEPYKGGEQDG